MLILDGFGSDTTKESLECRELDKMVKLALPSCTTHLLQPLDVCVFQPLKHWHLEAVIKAIYNVDTSVSRLEFLNAFNDFRARGFAKSTILSAWKNTQIQLGE